MASTVRLCKPARTPRSGWWRVITAWTKLLAGFSRKQLRCVVGRTVTGNIAFSCQPEGAGKAVNSGLLCNSAMR